ncbi:MAG: hypothetical protein HYZ51_00415 [Candidatus Doudnabacteria bacterium]|nr:hypothetical protein [Candidatus Doudnabacteria bacterium]
MNNKPLIFIVVLLTVSAAVVGYYWQKQTRQKLATQSVNNQSFQNLHANSSPSAEAREEGLRPSVEEFINQSAIEAQSPQAGRLENSPSVQKSIPTDSGQKPAILNPASTVLEAICQGSEASNFDCYQKYYQQLVRIQGVQAAFTDLRARYNQNSYVVAQCHPLTHVIGNSAIEKYPSASEAYLHGDSFCWSGYYHGALEGILAKVGRQNVASQINGICEKIPGKQNYSFDYYNCVHGLGHGLMAMTNTELFESLELCDNLIGSWEQASCYGGVFMENVIVDNKNHFTKYLKPEDPLYPCNASGERYKGACYLMQTSYMLKVTGGDFTKVFALCEKADVNYRVTCFQSLGRDASGRSSSNVQTTKSICVLGQNFEARSNCVVGAVKDFISYFHSDVRAKELCASLDQELQSICLSTAESYYKSF